MKLYVVAVLHNDGKILKTCTPFDGFGGFGFSKEANAGTVKCALLGNQVKRGIADNGWIDG